MKPSELIEALQRFFLDIIAYVIPGSTLLVGVALLLIPSSLAVILNAITGSSYYVLAFLAISYVIGQSIETAGNVVLEPVAAFLAKATRLWIKTPSVFLSANAQSGKLASGPVFHAFVSRVRSVLPNTISIPDAPAEFNTWRNIAMTYASAEDNHTTYRFMFISILNLGMAMVCFTLALLWTIVNRVSALRTLPMFAGARPWNPLIAGSLVVAACLFTRRRYDFLGRSMQTPFSMAIPKISPKESAPGNVTIPAFRPLKIYLAGGFHSGWQDIVSNALPMLQFFDPREHKLQAADQYTLWDLDTVRRCDIVLAYLEHGNPGGYALSLEVGFAKALGKRIVLVDEKSRSDPKLAKNLAMIRECADVKVESLDEAIAFLRQTGIVSTS